MDLWLALRWWRRGGGFLEVIRPTANAPRVHAHATYAKREFETSLLLTSMQKRNAWARPYISGPSLRPTGRVLLEALVARPCALHYIRWSIVEERGAPVVGVVRDRLTLWIGEAEGAAVRRALVFFQLYHLDDVRDARVPAVGRRAAAGRRLVGRLGAGGIAQQGRRCQAPHAAPTRIDVELD